MSKDYASFGLQAVKTSQEQGQAGARFCFWCSKNVSVGFSLCFQHFVICPDCVRSAHAVENRHRWKAPAQGLHGETECFKCSKGKGAKHSPEVYFSKADEISLCPDCINWAEEVLFKSTDPAPTAAAPETPATPNTLNNDDMQTANKPTLQNIYLTAIEPDPHQPRKIFRDASLQELAASIKANGVIQPIVVRYHPTEGSDILWRIITGERRWRAAKLAGLTVIPAIRNDSMSEKQILEVQIIENLQREGVHPMEEALAFEELGRQGLTQKEIGGRIGKGDRFVRERLALGRLSKPWQTLFMEGRIKLEQAMLLVKLAPELQDDFLKKEKPERGAPLTFSEWNLREYSGDLREAAFDLSDPTLNKKLGACTTCKYNSANNALTPLDRERPTCGLVTCFSSKSGVFFDRQLQAAKAADEEVLFVRNTYHSHGADKAVKKLREAGDMVLEQNQFSMVSIPAPVESWEAYLEDYRENYDDRDSEAEIRAAYENHLKRYNRELQRYEQAKASKTYKKALIVDGEGRGKLVLVEPREKGKEKEARKAIEAGKASLQDLKTEARRLQSDIKKQKERLADKVQEEIVRALDVHPITNSELQPFTRGDLALLAYFLFNELGGFSSTGSHLRGDEEHPLFMDALGAPAAIKDELDEDDPEEFNQIWQWLLTLEPQKIGLLFRRTILKKFANERPGSYHNAAHAFAIQKMAEERLGLDTVMGIEHQERLKAGKRLSNAEGRLEKLLSDIEAKESKASVKGRKKASPAIGAQPAPADPEEGFTFPDDLERIPTSAGEIRGSGMDIVAAIENENQEGAQ